MPYFRDSSFPIPHSPFLASPFPLLTIAALVLTQVFFRLKLKSRLIFFGTRISNLDSYFFDSIFFKVDSTHNFFFRLAFFPLWLEFQISTCVSCHDIWLFFWLYNFVNFYFANFDLPFFINFDAFYNFQLTFYVFQRIFIINMFLSATECHTRLHCLLKKWQI